MKARDVMPLIKEHGVEKGLTRSVIMLFEQLAANEQAINQLAQMVDQQSDMLATIANVGINQGEALNKMGKIMGADLDDGKSSAGGQG